MPQQNMPQRHSDPTQLELWQQKRQRELQLVQRVMQGDQASWFEFVERYAPMIHARVTDTARAFHLAKRAELIERLTAFVFNSLIVDDFAALQVYNGRSSLTAYLAVTATRVTRRACVRIRHLRQQKRQTTPPSPETPC